MEIFIPTNPYERFMVQPEQQVVSNGIRAVDDDWEEIRTTLRRWKEEAIQRRWKKEAEEFRRWKEDPAQQEEMPCFFCKIGSCLRVSCEGKKKMIQEAGEQEKMNLMAGGIRKTSVGEERHTSQFTGMETFYSPGERENVAEKDSSYTSPPQQMPSLKDNHKSHSAVRNPSQRAETIRTPRAFLLQNEGANRPLRPSPYPPEELSDVGWRNPVTSATSSEFRIRCERKEEIGQAMNPVGKPHPPPPLQSSLPLLPSPPSPEIEARNGRKTDLIAKTSKPSLCEMTAPLNEVTEKGNLGQNEYGLGITIWARDAVLGSSKRKDPSKKVKEKLSSRGPGKIVWAELKLLGPGYWDQDIKWAIRREEKESPGIKKMVTAKNPSSTLICSKVISPGLVKAVSASTHINPPPPLPSEEFFGAHRGEKEFE